MPGFLKNIQELSVRKKTVAGGKDTNSQKSLNDFADKIRAHNQVSAAPVNVGDVGTLGPHSLFKSVEKSDRDYSPSGLHRSYTDRQMTIEESETGIPDSKNKIRYNSKQLHLQFMERLHLDEYKTVHNEIFKIANSFRMGILEKILSLDISRFNLEESKDLRKINKGGCILCGCNCKINNIPVTPPPRNSNPQSDRSNFQQTSYMTLDLTENSTLKKCRKCSNYSLISESNNCCDSCLFSNASEVRLKDQICIALKIKSNLDKPSQSQKSSRVHEASPLSSVNVFERGKLRSITPPKRKLPSISGNSARDILTETSACSLELWIGDKRINIDLSIKNQVLNLLIPKPLKRVARSSLSKTPDKYEEKTSINSQPESLMQTTFNNLPVPQDMSKSPNTPSFRLPLHIVGKQEPTANQYLDVNQEVNGMLAIIEKLRNSCNGCLIKSVNQFRLLVSNQNTIDLKIEIFEYLENMKSIIKIVTKVFSPHAQILEVMTKSLTLLYLHQLDRIENLTQESLNYKLRALTLQNEMTKKDEEFENQYSHLNGILQKYEGIIDYYKLNERQ